MAENVLIEPPPPELLAGQGKDNKAVAKAAVEYLDKIRNPDDRARSARFIVDSFRDAYLKVDVLADAIDNFAKYKFGKEAAMAVIDRFDAPSAPPVGPTVKAKPVPPTEISSVDQFRDFLGELLREGSGGSGYRPIKGIPIVRVVEAGKKDTFYTVWHKDNGLALVSFEALSTVQKTNPQTDRALLQQSQAELIETGLGKRSPEISIRRQDIASISPKIEVTESEAQRVIREALERQQEFIRNQGKQVPPAPTTGTKAPDNTTGLPPEAAAVLAAMGRAPAGAAPATPASQGERVRSSQAELPRTFETAATPGAPVPATTVVAAAGQSAKSLADMGVLGNPTAKLEVNHEAALNASAAIRDKKLTPAQIETVIQSFKGDDKLKGFGAALEKQSKASDPAQGATVAGDEIHKARRELNKGERAARREERAVSTEEALDRVRRGMAQASDPGFIADAIRRVEPVLSGAISPTARQEAALIDGLMKDPKTEGELRKRFGESLQKAGMNPDKLPEGTRDFILGHALEQVGAQRAAILQAEKDGGREAARAKLLEIAQQGMNKGIQEIQSGVKPEVSKKPEQGSSGYSPAEIQKMQEEALRRATEGVRGGTPVKP